MKDRTNPKLYWHYFTLYLRCPLSFCFFLWLFLQKEDNNLLLRSFSFLEMLFLFLFLWKNIRKKEILSLPILLADGLVLLFSIPFLLFAPNKPFGILMLPGSIGEILYYLFLKREETNDPTK